MNSWEPTWPGRPTEANSLGRRIAALRTERRWTQQQLADRLGVSRVAVSHLETDINSPGERTVALLAGLFKLEPHDLVADTSYPAAKADRLPLVVARWTEVEHQLALLDHDLCWLEGAERRVAERVLQEWDERLAELAGSVHDRQEQDHLAVTRRRIADLRRSRHPSHSWTAEPSEGLRSGPGTGGARRTAARDGNGLGEVRQARNAPAVASPRAGR